MLFLTASNLFDSSFTRLLVLVLVLVRVNDDDDDDDDDDDNDDNVTNIILFLDYLLYPIEGHLVAINNNININNNIINNINTIKVN